VPTLSSYDFAFVRVVPQVTREEFINAGVILFCRALDFLDLRLELDSQRMLSLAPELDLRTVQSQLDVYRLICVGGPNSGPVGQLSKAERFHWLTSARSTTVQVSPVHCGLCCDPEATLQDLYARNVSSRHPAFEAANTDCATPEIVEESVD